VADAIWARFGDIEYFIDPFFGSGAVLFLRPSPPKREIINDKDYFVANFFRAIQQDPDQVAHWADWPIIDIELSAREYWLMQQEEFKKKMLFDPEYFDAKIAGWWVWGIGAAVGLNFCRRPNSRIAHALTLPQPENSEYAIYRKTLLVGKEIGIHRRATKRNLKEYFRFLRERLQFVQICCKEWHQILTPIKYPENGFSGIFLDPPYCRDKKSIDGRIYRDYSKNLADDVLKWAIDNGKKPKVRIALCGFLDDCAALDDWEKFTWKNTKGYLGPKKSTRPFEAIWFSPNCLKPDQLELFNEDNRTRRNHQ
jgi:site-specific DNA-adenine methylase